MSKRVNRCWRYLQIYVFLCVRVCAGDEQTHNNLMQIQKINSAINLIFVQLDLYLHSVSKG